MQKRFIVILLIATLLLNGCASMFHHGPSWLSVETTPENVQIKIYGLQNGETITKTTPCKIELSKSSDYKITVETPNYKSDEVIVRRKITGWFWANILLGGIVGMGIDALTHNMWDHNQHLATLDLQSLSNAPEKIQINLPITLYSPNGRKTTKFLPITFHKKKYCDLS